MPNEFRSLTVYNAGIGNLVLSLPASPNILFYVRNSQWPGNPSVTLSLGSKEGRTLSILKLGVFSENTVGLGNPKRDQIDYERLRYALFASDLLEISSTETKTVSPAKSASPVFRVQQPVAASVVSSKNS